ncbi:MAG: hypothetical protein CMH83_15735 [Nocardioides sp.]|nr:hypothetical protein [Nocardioides sp.]
MTVIRDYAAGLNQPTLGGDPHRYDEVVGRDGSLRAPWKGLAERAVRLTPGDLARADDDIVRALADDGVTYGRPGRRPGPWRLDPVPLILDAASWGQLEIGLAQRAELLNAVLADLYGERRLLAEGLVPPAVVMGHAGYARVVARPSFHEPHPLVLSATDLGRDAHGEWRVLADRTQAPSGLGYAMENRRVLSRVLPQLYRESGLHRMAPFFSALRSALQQAAAGDMPDPRVVVLSPGSHSETAYDQAFIASALGFPLVEGSDLVVCDGWVQMRVFGRLERVDVILRRVDSDWSDPLELRGDSRLGVAGLTEAVRRGRVRVVNGLGAGVLENPALLPYLPAVSEALLGEPLLLDSVPTWWCGDPESRERVLDDLEHLQVRRIDGPPTELAELGPDEIRARVLAAPHAYVGQELLPLSQAPVWRGATVPGREVRPQALTLRTFTLRYGSAYRPLVGGLVTLIEPANAVDRWSPQRSKDLWVLKEDPAQPDQGLPEVQPLTHARSSTGTVPRVLEDMFWFGRESERCEDMLRLVLVCHALADDYRTRPTSTGNQGLQVMLTAVARLAGRQDTDDLDAEFRSLLLDYDRVGSFAHSLDGLRDALAGVRDQLSPDIWRAFGVTERAAYALETNNHSHQVADSAGRMLTGVLSLQGVLANMIRDHGWHMVHLGHHLERALQLCHLMRATTTRRRGIDVDREVLTAVLNAAESAVTHQRRYRGYVRTGGVLELLLTDPDNPRSLQFNLAELATHLAALPASTGSSRPERLVTVLLEQLAETEVATLVAIGGESRPNLEAFLDQMLAQLTRLGEAVSELHLATGPAPQSLVGLPVVDSFDTDAATGEVRLP